MSIPASTEPKHPNNGLIAVAQMCSTDDHEHNIEIVESILKEASAMFGSLLKFIFFPESFEYVGGSSSKKVVHESLDGPLFTRYKSFAKRYNIWISYGGFHEAIEGSEKTYNTHVIVDDQGEIRATYRKLHMCTVETEGGMMDESQTCEPGNELVVCDSPIGKLGLSICFDLRFSELYITLREMGAEVILIPSAFVLETGINHWEVLTRARAIESQCFVVASGQIGQHNEERVSFGKSLVVDPMGQVVATCTDTNPTFTITHINHRRIEESRNKIRSFENRRTEVYEKYRVNPFK